MLHSVLRLSNSKPSVVATDNKNKNKNTSNHFVVGLLCGDVVLNDGPVVGRRRRKKMVVARSVLLVLKLQER
jgi:hypothetical protein